MAVELFSGAFIVLLDRTPSCQAGVLGVRFKLPYRPACPMAALTQTGGPSGVLKKGQKVEIWEHILSPRSSGCGILTTGVTDTQAGTLRLTWWSTAWKKQEGEHLLIKEPADDPTTNA